jgi:hypothetical protein
MVDAPMTRDDFVTVAYGTGLVAACSLILWLTADLPHLLF